MSYIKIQLVRRLHSPHQTETMQLDEEYFFYISLTHLGPGTWNCFLPHQLAQPLISSSEAFFKMPFAFWIGNGNAQEESLFSNVALSSPDRFTRHQFDFFKKLTKAISGWFLLLTYSAILSRAIPFNAHLTLMNLEGFVIISHRYWLLSSCLFLLACEFV